MKVIFLRLLVFDFVYKKRPPGFFRSFPAVVFLFVIGGCRGVSYVSGGVYTVVGMYRWVSSVLYIGECALLSSIYFSNGFLSVTLIYPVMRFRLSLFYIPRNGCCVTAFLYNPVMGVVSPLFYNTL